MDFTKRFCTPLDLPAKQYETLEKEAVVGAGVIGQWEIVEHQEQQEDS